MRITLIVIVILAALVPAQAQSARAVAVADFVETGADSGLLPSALLNQVLQDLLQQRAAGRFRVIAGDSVREALRARGYTAEDLISPSRAVEIAQAVGADWLVTGRWTHLRFIGRSTPEDPTTPSIRQGDMLAYAAVEIRVLEAATRRILFEGRFTGEATGGDLASLLLAATEALRDAAVRIAQL